MTDITSDLMIKIGNDVTSAMTRTLALTNEHLPVAMAGGSAAIGIIAAFLEVQDGGPRKDAPDPDCILLAALLCARTGMSHVDPIRQAYRDLEALKNTAIQEARTR